MSGNHGGNDYWIIKLDNNGILQWQKSLGGSLDDIAYSVDQVLDGGYVIAGKSNSNDGDVTNHHGSSMYYDSWIVKLDTNGNIEWQNSIGGNNDDIGLSIKQTSDGGFIVGGNSWSNDGDVTGHHGPTDNQYEWNPDQWIVKLNSFGIIQWQKSFGGTGDDRVGSVEETDDGGYIIGGSSWSNDGDITGHKSRSDYWIVKINIIGDIQWEKSFGGSGDDFAGNIKQTIDKGYIITGQSTSNDGDVIGNINNFNGLDGDYWIVKLDSNGNLKWQKSLGGTYNESSHSIQQTNNEDNKITKASFSNDGNITDHHGSTNFSDYWIVKLSSDKMSTQDSQNAITKIYPNPAKNIINFSEEVSNIKISDFSGKIINQISTYEKSIKVSKLKKGTYIFSATSKSGEIINKKVIKE